MRRHGDGFFDISTFVKRGLSECFITGISPLKTELASESINPEGRVCFRPEYHKIYGLTTDCANIRQSEKFHFAAGDIYNNSDTELNSMTYYVAHCDAAGNIKEVLHTEYMGPLSAGRYENITVSRELICNEPVESTDRLCLFFTNDTHPEKTRIYGYGAYPSGCPMTNHTVRYIPVEYELDKGITVGSYFEHLPNIYEAVAGMSLFYSVYADEEVSSVTRWLGDLEIETLRGNDIHGGSAYNAAWWTIAGNNCEKTIKVRLTSDLGPVVRDAEIHIDNPGWLGVELFNNYDLNELTSLKVTGTIDAGDISYASVNCPNLQEVDLSGCELVSNDDLTVAAPIPDWMFGTRPLRKMLLPANLIGIGANSLRMTDLVEIDLPQTIESIGENSLGENPRLRKVIARMSDPVAVSGSTFADVSQATLVVNTGCRAKYAAAEGWKNFGTIVEEQLWSAVGGIVAAEAAGLEEIYDLTGRRVSADRLQPGQIYIVRKGAHGRFVGEKIVKTCKRM